MTRRDLVVVGGSAGGFEPLLALVAGLPADVPLALLLVIHTARDAPGALPEALSRKGPFPARYAVDGEPIRPGVIYVAPPDRHLIVEDGRLALTRGPRENRFRPAVDPLFRTAAKSYGERVIGVVLSGSLSDGTNGLGVIKRHGGVAIAQRIDEAIVPSMPLSAIQNVDVDHIVPAAEIGPLIARLAVEPVTGGSDHMWTGPKVDAAEHGTHGLHDDHPKGPPSVFTCPECGGALWERKDASIVRFNCHVGHALTEESLMAGQADGIEVALWTALRALEESAAFRRRLAERAAERGLEAVARGYRENATDAEYRANVIREVLTNDRPAEVRAIRAPTRRRAGRRRGKAKRPRAER